MEKLQNKLVEKRNWWGEQRDTEVIHTHASTLTNMCMYAGAQKCHVVIQ